VLRDEDVDELVVQPDGAMEQTNKRRWVMRTEFCWVMLWWKRKMEDGEEKRGF
jgi:hypothetical protein